MPRLKSLIHEIHRRSLWQVLLVYVGSAWLVLEAVDVLASSYGLPTWFPPFALALLLIGLPIVLATAFVQESERKVEAHEPTYRDPTLMPEGLRDPEPVDGGPAADDGPSHRLRELLTWRNAILGGVLALAFWGVVAAGWVVLGAPELFILKAEAADFFTARDRVVVAEFENETDQAALGLAIREAIVTDLDQSEYVNVLSEAMLDDALGRMRLPDTTRIDADVAVEIARREGLPAVVTGGVAPLGAGFQLTARVIESATGEVAVRVRETAANEEEVLPAVEKLARVVRRHLGESLASVRRSEPLPQVTTSSLEALELFARARQLNDRGDQEGAIRLLHEAVGRDTAFAAAWRGLGVYYGNRGDWAAAQSAVDRAHRFSERLPDKERLLTAALYHSYRNRADSMVYYYRLAVERDPGNYVPVNNLGDAYERMGRYEEALEQYRRTVELHPEAVNTHLNRVSAAQTLELHAEAESALAIMQLKFPEAPGTRFMRASHSYYVEEYDEAEAAARELAIEPDAFSRAWGHAMLASLGGLRGQVDRALAHADSATRFGVEAESRLAVYLAGVAAYNTALAAGMPERALPYLERALEQARLETGAWPRYLALGIVAQGYALLNDPARARAIVVEMDSLAGAAQFRPSGQAEEIRATIALQEERPQDALEHLRQARAQDYGMLFRTGHLLTADAHAALGDLEAAAAHYDTLTGSRRLDFRDLVGDGPRRSLAHERLGSTYLALGDTTAALRHLARFTELWQDADPALQPRVESARRTLGRLVGEGS